MKFIYNALTKSISIEDCDELQGLTFTSHELSPEELQSKVELIISNIIKLPLAFSTTQKALKDGKIVVDFHKNMRSSAAWCWNTRVISIKQDESDPHIILDSFIFEICNANNKEYSKIVLQDCKDAEDFVYKMETAEYTYTANVAAEIMQQGCSTAIGWPLPKNNHEVRKIETLQNYLITSYSPHSANVQNQHGLSHADTYRQQYYNTMMPIYERQIKSFEANITTLKMLVPARDKYFVAADALELQLKENQIKLDNLKALEATTRALATSTNNSNIEQEYKEAIESLEKLIKVQKDDYDALFKMSNTYYENAKSTVEALIKEKESECDALKVKLINAVEELQRIEKKSTQELKNEDENSKIETSISEMSKEVPPLILELKTLKDLLGPEKCWTEKDNLQRLRETHAKIQAMYKDVESIANIDRKVCYELLKEFLTNAKNILKNLQTISIESSSTDTFLTAYPMTVNKSVSSITPSLKSEGDAKVTLRVTG